MAEKKVICFKWETVSMSYFSYFVTHILYIAIYNEAYIYIFFTDMDTSCALNTWKTGLSLKLHIYKNQLYDLYLLVHTLAVNLLIA